MQRFFDILFSSFAIIILSPILLVIIIVLLLTGEHKVFYLQKRIGKYGRPFYLFKFTTMITDAEKMGLGDITVRNDARVLPVGKILRITKLNELPQLLNIFIGNMSVIGPRPLLESGYNCYSLSVKNMINQVSPGLSGIGSIVFRDEEEILTLVDDPKYFLDNVISSYKGELEVWYVKNRCIGLYFKLIILTVISVFNSKSNLYRRWLKDLPPIPDMLKQYIY